MAAVGFQHILHNLELYGFGSEEAGIVQTVKELAENAFDACKGQSKETYIRVSVTDAHAGFVKIEVMDNGCGITDCENILQCFVSTKQANASSSMTTGKFGVGLTACLLYSHAAAQQSMRLTTTVPEWNVAEWTEICFDAEANSLAVHRRATAPKPMRSGTIVHSVVPASAASLQNALATLQSYFRSYAYNPWRSTAVEFRANALECTLHLQLPAGPRLCIGDVQFIDDWQISVYKSLLQSFEALTGHRLEGEQLGVSLVSKLGWSCFAAVAILPSERRNDTGTLSSANHCPVLRLHRYAHGIPLLESPESVGCLLSWCLRAVKWQHHGFHLASKHATGQEQPYHQLFHIQSANNESEEEFEERFGWVSEIVVMVDICEGPVPFSTATKTVVGKGYKRLAQLVRAAIAEAATATFRNFPQTFMSAQAAKARKMRTTDIPCIAHAISEIVARSRDIAFQESCMALLQLPANFVNPNLLAPLLAERILDIVNSAESSSASS